MFSKNKIFAVIAILALTLCASTIITTDIQGDNDDSNYTYKCYTCGQEFTDLDAFEKHAQAHMEESQKKTNNLIAFDQMFTFIIIIAAIGIIVYIGFFRNKKQKADESEVNGLREKYLGNDDNEPKH